MTKREKELIEDKAHWINKWKEQLKYTSELLQQVYELKQENSVLSITVELQDNAIEQAVKDTAKEIYDWLKEHYGVEVE